MESDGKDDSNTSGHPLLNILTKLRISTDSIGVMMIDQGSLVISSMMQIHLKIY